MENGSGWLLAGSLAVNLFLGGVLAGGWIRDLRDPPTARAAFHLGPPRLDIPRMAERLPEPARGVAGEILERRGQAIGAAFRALREARREAHEALVAEPFEAARLGRAFETPPRPLLASPCPGPRGDVRNSWNGSSPKPGANWPST